MFKKIKTNIEKINNEKKLNEHEIVKELSKKLSAIEIELIKSSNNQGKEFLEILYENMKMDEFASIGSDFYYYKMKIDELINKNKILKEELNRNRNMDVTIFRKIINNFLLDEDICYIINHSMDDDFEQKFYDIIISRIQSDLKKKNDKLKNKTPEELFVEYLNLTNKLKERDFIETIKSALNNK